jgi:diguanylate cyclase (GGDEF)-like protein
MTHAPPAPAQPSEEVRRLGEALNERKEEVLRRTVARTRRDSPLLDALVRDSFERICLLTTAAVARWMAGDDPETTMAVGREAGQIFGQLAGRRAAPLHEVIKRCVRWRKVTAEVLGESAAQLGVSQEALFDALRMLQVSLEMTIVTVGERFEVERRRADDELVRREEELAFLATHDSLTGLPNRTLILDRVERMLVRSRRDREPMAVLLVDLDNFKSVNDTSGHDAGDGILGAVALRLDGTMRAGDTLGRLGGDEFVIVAEELSTVSAELIAQRLLETLSEPFELTGEHGARFNVTASIGIAICGRGAADKTSAEELVRDASIAAYRAKWDGKDRCVVFESSMQHAVQSRIQLEMDLRDALPNDEFFLVYQPTFDLGDLTPIGVEALLRWKHPTRGVVQPDDFIPLLEETGLITTVGRWVLKDACRQGAAWREAGHVIGVAVNVSGRQFDTDELVTDVADALADSGLDASALTLEITETTLMADVEETARRLTAIRDLGVRVAIDDFGTGYSSLAHLQRFPVDALKIDRSFVGRLIGNPESEALVRTLVQLGSALSIETLAEGIEQEQELAFLRNEHCDSGQGFLLARPLGADAVEAFLREFAMGVAPAPKKLPASAPSSSGRIALSPPSSGSRGRLSA